jgi:ribonuclease VapC
LLEARIVASRANHIVELDAILNASISEVIPVTAERAIFMSNVYQMWGKGFHAASLNFGDCFSYATAKEFACPSSTSARTSPKPTSRPPSRLGANVIL